MRILHVLAYLVLLVLGEGTRTSGVTHRILKGGGRILRVETVVLCVPVINLCIIKHIAVGNAVALVDAIKVGLTAGDHGDLTLYKLAVCDMTQVVTIAQGLESLHHRIQCFSILGFKVNQERNRSGWLRLVNAIIAGLASIVVVQDGA